MPVFLQTLILLVAVKRCKWNGTGECLLAAISPKSFVITCSGYHLATGFDRCEQSKR